MDRKPVKRSQNGDNVMALLKPVRSLAAAFWTSWRQERDFWVMPERTVSVIP